MTTKQADKLIGKEIKVRWPNYNDEGIIVIVSRRPRSSIVEAQVRSYGGRLGVFNLSEMELLSIN